MQTFEVGDKVQLKSGGPVMTVDTVGWGGKPEEIRCRWYSDKDDQYKVAVFHKDMLKLFEK